MTKVHEWINSGTMIVTLVVGLAGGWSYLNSEVARVVGRVANVERRVDANEDYDGHLQSSVDLLKERVIKNESNIEHISGSLEDIATSMKDIAREIKTTNDNLNKYMLEHAGSKNG